MSPPLVVTESGFRVTAPQPAFRFADFPSYRALSGKHLKEMDVGWQDQSAGGKARLVLLELKGREVWTTMPDDPTKPHEHLVRTCVTKATDTLLMLASAWLPTGTGQGLRACLPRPLDAHDPLRALRFVFLVDLPEGSRELLLPVREAIKKQLEGRLATFDIKAVSVVDLAGAVKLGLPIERA